MMYIKKLQLPLAQVHRCFGNVLNRLLYDVVFYVTLRDSNHYLTTQIELLWALQYFHGYEARHLRVVAMQSGPAAAAVNLPGRNRFVRSSEPEKKQKYIFRSYDLLCRRDHWGIFTGTKLEAVMSWKLTKDKTRFTFYRGLSGKSQESRLYLLKAAIVKSTKKPED